MNALFGPYTHTTPPPTGGHSLIQSSPANMRARVKSGLACAPIDRVCRAVRPPLLAYNKLSIIHAMTESAFRRLLFHLHLSRSRAELETLSLFAVRQTKKVTPTERARSSKHRRTDHLMAMISEIGRR